LTPELAGPLREAEERAAAAVVGVDGVEFLGLPDGMLEYGLVLRRAITAAIRRHRPEVVISLNQHDSFGPGALNQPDHIAVGKAVIDAVRDAVRPMGVPRPAGRRARPLARRPRVVRPASRHPTRCPVRRVVRDAPLRHTR